MALTLASVPTTDIGVKVPGSRRNGIFTVTFDNSYPTGGYAVTAAAVGLTALHSVLVGVSSAGRPVFWTGSKLKVFSAVSTEIANAVDLSADSCIIEVRGS